MRIFIAHHELRNIYYSVRRVSVVPSLFTNLLVNSHLK